MSLVPDDELAKLVREEPAGARDLALLGRARRKQGTGPPRVHRLAAQKTRGEAGVPDDRPHLLRRLRRLEIQRLRGLRRVGVCVEINQCDGCSTILY